MNMPVLTSPAVKQNGHILFVILAVIFIGLAGAYFLVHDTTHPQANHERNDISSIAVMQYTASIGRGIHRMMAKGIPLDEIEFYAPIDQHFTDIAESDEAKKLLFHPDGGGVTYFPVDRDAVEKVTRYVGKTQNGNWHFMKLPVKSVGTDMPEMIALLYRVKPDICANINLELIGNTTIPTFPVSGEEFIKGQTPLDGPGIDGVNNLCFRTSDGRHVFYSVLLAQ